MTIKAQVEVQNCTGEEKKYIVATLVDGQLWLWGSYDKERAESVRRELDAEYKGEHHVVVERAETYEGE